MNYDELKRLSLDFRNVSQRMLRSDHVDGIQNIQRFLHVIDSSPTISDFIKNKHVGTYDIEMIHSGLEYGDRFPVPTDPNEEVSFVYQLLAYVSSHLQDPFDFAINYAPSSNKLQTHFEAFMKSVVWPFVTHINSHLEELMDGTPERKAASAVNFQIGGNVQQLNFAQNNSTISAINLTPSQASVDEAAKRFLEVLARGNVPPDIRESIEELVHGALDETKISKPKKSLIRLCAEQIPTLLSAATVGLETVKAGKDFVEALQSFLG